MFFKVVSSIISKISFKTLLGSVKKSLWKNPKIQAQHFDNIHDSAIPVPTVLSEIGKELESLEERLEFFDQIC